MTRKAIVYKSLQHNENEKLYEVFWHAWGQTGDSNGTYPAAICEKENGEVIIVDADQLQFIIPIGQEGKRRINK